MYKGELTYLKDLHQSIFKGMKGAVKDTDKEYNYHKTKISSSVMRLWIESNPVIKPTRSDAPCYIKLHLHHYLFCANTQ